MCHYFNPGAVDDCDEERADPPVIKESANFCEYYKPIPGRFKGETLTKQIKAVSDLNSLFGEDAEGEPSESDTHVGSDKNEGARLRLDDLFDS
jgi:hypothetical protein